jgi:Ni/Co efflux regulator RcnB
MRVTGLTTLRPLAAALLAMALVAAPLAAQQDKQAQAGKSGAKDSKIKNDSDQNSATPPEPATTSRRAARAHGGSIEGTCEIRIHNYTYLKVKIFVNGEYLALVSPYGNATITGDAGTKLEVYERADFIGGKEYKFWPTSNYDCSAGQQVDENLN